MEQVNYLEIADALIRNITGQQSPQVDAAVASAAALIAIAERLGQIIDHLAAIRDHQDDIGTTLLNAVGPDGAVKTTCIDNWT